MMVRLDPQTQPAARKPHNRVREALPVLCIGIALLSLYTAVLPHLIADWWNDPDYSHGFLIPLISAYFAWERREQFLQTVARPSFWGCVGIVGGTLCLFLGTLGAELFLTRISLVVILVGLVLYHHGWARLRVLTFPLAFLFFMIPLPAIVLNTMTFPLQLLSARLSTSSLQFMHLPVYREGNVIFLPHATLEVVEACSGLRSLMSLLALAVIFAYMTQRVPWKLSCLIVSAVPIAIVANAFRIWGTGILSYLYGVQAAEGFYHAFAGWLVFVVAFVLLAIEGFVLSYLGRPTRMEAAAL
jgi:exosortase